MYNPQQDQMDAEHEQALAMRQQLNHESVEFVNHLRQWAKIDSRDAENCLFGVIRKFYEPEKVEPEKKKNHKVGESTPKIYLFNQNLNHV